MCSFNSEEWRTIILNTPGAGKEEEGTLQIMAWPFQSPDLNPIEKLWDQLDRKVRKECVTSKENLQRALQREWNNIQQETLTKLVTRSECVRWIRLTLLGKFLFTFEYRVSKRFNFYNIHLTIKAGNLIIEINFRLTYICRTTKKHLAL
ncbi:hypothetical protein GEV33_010097 [Tenebrio molitor]|uniref:Tc1-like transposase DDE domain-containing protein n=1 Tax=Tenebrio molitor TaxID=7067 RepID=A0A8J6L711_TENMO|nr:hypothetical protein GEV33_010097 [Tenebrio molitor]